MKKGLLLTVFFASFITAAFSQTDKFWSVNNEPRKNIPAYKAVARLSFPKDFTLFTLNTAALRLELFSVVGQQSSRHATVISLPNGAGKLEQFEVFEASNFEPDLQANFPEIRAFSGKGITDRSATVKLSISPQGIQTMIFRTEKENEFIEPYSQDHSVYAVFKSQRVKGNLPWTCTTDEQASFSEINRQIASSNRPSSSTGELKTMRLAQSCNGEYSNYFNAFSAADVALVLAAFNTTLTRCNGVYEKDLALHLNLIANTTAVIYYNPATDPYTTLAAWNGQLQTTLTSVIGAANYDIGHMFGASGGGGNAGCIGCVCGANKGSGITSPADAIPEGDNFDIDYVVHEVGHQLGANHTFSFNNEGSGVNKEVGSGITIMGYAGITGQDVAPHSIDIFHEASIQQIETNLATKTCPITTNITAANATPVVAPVANYTIPISTPFALTGSATDANAGDVLTYCWEQNDNATNAQTNNASVASPTKASGPNWLSFSPSTSPTRTCPILPRILTGALTTPSLPGGDAIATIEALSSVSRTLNFRLTVRDNAPYSSTAPVKVGQTAFTDMQVIVTNTSGPFAVTAPNTNVTWPGGSTQTVTWSVANTTAAPVSCANVKISLSTDGGQTFPTVLVASTGNDGTETVTIPSTATTTARIKVESVGNIFFDIDNSDFTISAPANGFTFNSVAPTSVPCGTATAAATLATASQGGFLTPITLSATGNPAGTTVTFSSNPVVPGNSTTVTLNNVNTLAPGIYNVTVNGVAGSVSQSGTIAFTVQPGTPPSITTQPAGVTVCAGSNAVFNVVSPGPGLLYQWQVSNGGPFADITGATASSYTATAVTGADNNNQYQVIVSTLCGSSTSAAATLTVDTAPAVTAQPAAAVICAGNDNTFTLTATGAGLTYQWQQSITGCAGTFVNIPGATSPAYTLTNITLLQDGYAYQCIVSGTCAPTSVISNCAALSVSSSVGIVAQPTNVIACNGSNAVFTVNASGTGVNYQWQVSTGGPFTDITGATGASYTVTGVTAANSGNQYQVVLTNSTCTVPSFSTPATLTVNELPAVTTQPAAVTICAGSNTTFTSAATGTNIAYQWQVSTGGPFTDIVGATNAGYTVTAATAGQNNSQYQVVVSGACTPAAVSSAATLTVISPATIAVQPLNTPVCEGSDATLTVTGTSGGAPAIIYQWQVSTGGPFTNIAGATTASYTITGATAASNGNQYQVLLSNATCAATATSTPITLTVNALPVVTASADAAGVCTGTNAQLTATGAVSYVWTPAATLNDATIANPIATPVVNPSTPGQPNPVVYTVTGTDANGCVNTNTVTVTANPLPVVTLTATPANTSLVAGQSVLLKASVTPIGSFLYTWTKDGVVIPNTTDSLRVTANDGGAYAVTAGNNPGGDCASKSNAIEVSDSATVKLFVFPNPNNGQFFVSYHNPGGVPTGRNVTVYDNKGARVFTQKLTISQPYQLIRIDLRPASAGLYIIVLYDGAGNRLATEKVIVQN